MSLSKIGGYPIDLNKITDDSIIIDAGVCKGKFISELKEHVSCKIIGLEACTRNFNNLNYENTHNVALVGLGRPETISFYDYDGFSDMGRGSIFNKSSDDKFNNYNKITVPTITLEKFDRIDYLKLDVEGAEYEIFDTMTNEIANKIKQFSMEVHHNIDYLNFPEAQRGKKLAMHIIKRIIDLGFSIGINAEEGILYGCR